MGKKGQLICFTGIDGSGKTTLAKKVSNLLIKKKLPAKYVYGRFELVLSKFMVIIANKIFLKNYSATKDYNEYTDKKKDLFKKNNTLLIIYLGILMFDYLFQLFVKIKIPMLFGKTVICDRYVYDTGITDISVDMNFSKNEVISLIDKCFLFVPKPNITFLVDVSENVAFARKDDISSVDYLKDRRNTYLDLADYYEMKILDGNFESEKVFSDCTECLKNELNF